MKYSLDKILLEIHNKEDKILSQSKRLIDEAYEMKRAAVSWKFGEGGRPLRH